MPFLPVPPTKPSATVSSEVVQGGHRDGWTFTGSYWGRQTLSSSSPQTTMWSTARLRKANQLRRLKVGTLWAPCSSYQRAACLVNYQRGTIETVFRVARDKPYWKYSTTAWKGFQAEVGPFVRSLDWLPSGPSANERARLSTELLLKVGSRKASYGEAIVESRKTIRHLTSTVRTVVRAILFARKGQWGRVAHELGVGKRKLLHGGSLEQRWLEYSYAWLPLLSDIRDTHELLKKGFREESQIMSSVRVLTDQHFYDGPGGPFGGNPSVNRESTHGESKVEYRMKVFYSAQDSYLARANQLMLLNPLEVAWAVVPFSFVIDWLLPIGDVLESLMAPIGVDFIDGYLSTRVTGFYTTKVKVSVASDEFLLYNGVFTTTEYDGFAREKLTSFPLPGVFVKNPFSLNHSISAIALLRQLR